MVEEERIRQLNNKPVKNGRYVLYWMQASQRTEYNHALEFAVLQSNALSLPLVVFFGLTDRFPEANERHYHFMLQGLKEVKDSLYDRGILMVIRKISPEKGATELAAEASMVVCDKGYLGIQRRWRRYVADHANCAVLEVETDAVIPVETASKKEEYSAATLRRKALPLLFRFVTSLEQGTTLIDSTTMGLSSIDISDTERLVSSLEIDHSVKAVPQFPGGSTRAKALLELFVEHKLETYAECRNDPTQDCQSGLSPYLHFGQISPVYIARVLQDIDWSENVDDFLEELIIRRELSLNFCYFNQRYDSYEGLPQWARNTLLQHTRDHRDYVYSVDQLERGSTHDRYWNAAQKQLVVTGKMHGYMRMYWGKKILEWSESPEKAFNAALTLNNKYSLDGRDPNSFAGVAWCFGKHDRPWPERSVFGTVRYMNVQGLKRKFDIEKYARKWV